MPTRAKNEDRANTTGDGTSSAGTARSEQLYNTKACSGQTPLVATNEKHFRASTPGTDKQAPLAQHGATKNKKMLAAAGRH